MEVNSAVEVGYLGGELLGHAVGDAWRASGDGGTLLGALGQVEAGVEPASSEIRRVGEPEEDLGGGERAFAYECQGDFAGWGDGGLGAINGAVRVFVDEYGEAIVVQEGALLRVVVEAVAAVGLNSG
eukprot:TRINITY_DN35559_c0_g1_i3.p2 TRINITY_DN35559_c0_g1~~TRINITY_DN35559_c0_g1_i3.p2  ORF type:complete len:127 (-),score=21.23 TRINITY_DN35559_c0_g1_i3:431-811(-)